jgi:hypothetical protein
MQVLPGLVLFLLCLFKEFNAYKFLLVGTIELLLLAHKVAATAQDKQMEVYKQAVVAE